MLVSRPASKPDGMKREFREIPSRSRRDGINRKLTRNCDPDLTLKYDKISDVECHCSAIMLREDTRRPGKPGDLPALLEAISKMVLR